jgi:hypothetical protein
VELRGLEPLTPCLQTTGSTSISVHPRRSPSLDVYLDPCGFSFWGSPKRLGLLPYFATLVELSPADHVSATINQGDTGRPGVAEQMLADAGLEFAGRGAAQVINEFPDLAVRALAAAGPSWPALKHGGQDRFAEAMPETLSPLYAEGLGVRIVSELGWVIGTVPSA